MNDSTKPGKIMEGAKFTTEKKYLKNGKVIPYKTCSQEYLFMNDENQPEASFFLYTFIKSDEDDARKRPVIFTYGGGPGDASSPIGFWGPKIMDESNTANVGPFPEPVDNPDWLIEECDIVCMDPPGAGYGRIFQYDQRMKYIGVENDALIFIDMIKYWLRQYDRWMSPKYISGSSYGGIRTAFLMDYLCGGPYYRHQRQYTHGVALNGAILGCTALDIDFSRLDENESSGGVATTGANVFMSYAASNWYWNREGKPELGEFIDLANEFVANDYLKACWLAEDLPVSERKAFLDKITYFTGMPADIVLEYNYDVPVYIFCQELLRSKSLRLSTYDTRNTLTSSRNIGLFDDYSDDSSNAKGTFRLAPVFNEYSKKFLEIDNDYEWIEVNFDINSQWTWDSDRTILQHFIAAMRRNTDMKALLFGGVFDLAAPVGSIRNSIRHTGIDRTRILVHESPNAGHSICGNADSRKEYAECIKQLMK
jgi:carboxypeptidase C (cathepsin A)